MQRFCGQSSYKMTMKNPLQNGEIMKQPTPNASKDHNMLHYIKVSKDIKTIP